MKSPFAKHLKAPPGAIAGKVSLQRGLSLVELMISITIGLIILAALSSLFVNQSKTRAELDKSNRMIDNGRYALEVLSENLSLAGFYGEFMPGAGVNPPIPGTLPDPCATDPGEMDDALQLAIQGYEAAAQTSQIAGPPCGFTYATGNDRSLKAGSDILAIRRASTAGAITAGVALAGVHYFQVSHCEYDSAPLYKLDTDPADFTLRKKGCTPASTNYADLRNFMVQVYFVSPHSTTGDGIPTLKRYELDANTHNFVVTPLVEGIEYMQVDYGVDTNNNGTPDSYVTAPADTTAWSNVVVVKMNILARNTEPSPGYTDTKTYNLGLAGTFGPFNDNYKRHAYTKFIRLINPAGRRE